MITIWTHTWNQNAKTQTQNHKNRSRSWPEVEKGAREGGPVVAERRKSRLLAKPQIHNDQKLSFPPSQAPPHRATCANSTGGEGWENKQGGVFAFTW